MSPPIRASLNPKHRDSLRGKILVTVPLDNALIIPQQATFEVLDKKFVFVIDEHHVVHQREITIAHEMPQVYIVEKGLEATDKILLEGLRRVREGSEIDVNYQEPLTVLASLELPAE